jgi:hypothetical protein
MSASTLHSAQKTANVPSQFNRPERPLCAEKTTAAALSMNEIARRQFFIENRPWTKFGNPKVSVDINGHRPALSLCPRC